MVRPPLSRQGPQAPRQACGRRPARAWRSLPAALVATAGSLVLAGCSLFGGSDAAVEKGLQATGISKPPLLEGLSLEQAQAALKTDVTLRLHAADNLNTDPGGRPLSVVVRIYRLKDASAFLQAPYQAFQADAKTSPPPFAADLIDVREVVLTPGQKHEVIEALPNSVRALGVVALFRSPAEGRWRFVFDVKASQAGGITLGAHGCALSVSQGQAIDATPELMRVAGVRCRPSAAAPARDMK